MTIFYNLRRALLISVVSLMAFNIFSQGYVTSECDVDWTKKIFHSYLSIDMDKSGLSMPSGKSVAMGFVKMRIPGLLKDPVLGFYVDNANYLGDMVISESVTFEDISKIIEQGTLTPEVFVMDKRVLTTHDTISMDEFNKQLVKHKYAVNTEEPIDSIASRAYTGVIIDARNALPVQGEYIKSQTFPCFFPCVWDEQMSLIYEKNVVDSTIAIKQGITAYDYRDDFSLYEGKVGLDPLYIRAIKVFGRNRTDPVISRKDALRLIANKDNKELLAQGKVIILLNKENLIYKVSVPQKSPEYYVSYKKVKQYIYENKIEDIDVTDYITGMRFRVDDLKFVPDSPELLAEDKARIKKIAVMLLDVIKSGEYTIMVEGHAADLGRPEGQMTLSIQRTQTVIKELVKEGIPESLFSYKGYGATMPVADNKTSEGRAKNRRVDIIARPKGTYMQTSN